MSIELCILNYLIADSIHCLLSTRVRDASIFGMMLLVLILVAAGVCLGQHFGYCLSNSWIDENGVKYYSGGSKSKFEEKKE